MIQDMRVRDLLGQTFGRLTVFEKVQLRSSDGRSRIYWKCQCVCGRVVSIDASALVSRATTSCGCFRTEGLVARSRTHGGKSGKESPEYKAWQHAKARCYNRNDAKYPLYGGRGIQMCDRWLSDFAAFRDDMGLRPSSLHSLDRINVDGHYEPGNCRWATPREQGNNRRTTIRVTVDGIERSLGEWAELTGAKVGTLWERWKHGRPILESHRH